MAIGQLTEMYAIKSFNGIFLYDSGIFLMAEESLIGAIVIPPQP